MKTRYLYSGQPLEGLVSVSQIQTYLSCKKKWEYNYIENIKPRVDRAYLTIGKLCHKGMQTAMQELWKMQNERSVWSAVRCKEDLLTDIGVTAIRDEMNVYISETPLLDEELPDIDQMFDDACNVFKQAIREFDPLKYEVLSVRKHEPALELHFIVPCPGSKGLHGYIDAILKDKETGSLWCVDYKFRKTLAPDDDESFNIQNAVYSYACMKMGIPITGTLTWQHTNTPAADPKLNKDGTVSTAKIRTTWEHYKEYVEFLGKDPKDYASMEDKLADIEWYRATYEYRNTSTINNMWNECVVPVSKEIKKSHRPNFNNFRSLYPWNCKMCQYQSLCQAELRNYDSKAIREREYVCRTEISTEGFPLTSEIGEDKDAT